jgi:hypothetical protein
MCAGGSGGAGSRREEEEQEEEQEEDEQEQEQEEEKVSNVSRRPGESLACSITGVGNLSSFCWRVQARGAGTESWQWMVGMSCMHWRKKWGV